jgi:3'(2'), 5'-bisphosphate nucleotidase
MARTAIPFRTHSQRAHFALQVLRAGAMLARSVQQERAVPSASKSDRSPVTVADYAVQALVGGMLEPRFPGEFLVAEEDSRALRAAPPAMAGMVADYVRRYLPGARPEDIWRWIDIGRSSSQGAYWVLDPVDGTKGFLRSDQYVVALAWIEEAQVVLGGLGCPHLAAPGTAATSSGSVVLAVRGEGAWITPLDRDAWQRMNVSSQSRPEKARLLRSFEAGHTDEGMLDELARHLGCTVPPLRMDSQAKYARLAMGEGELLFRLLSPARPDYCEKIWDQAAGSLVVEEAGGRVTDLRGEPLDFGRGRELTANVGVLASNGLLHQAALQALTELGADHRPG